MSCMEIVFSYVMTEIMEGESLSGGVSGCPDANVRTSREACIVFSLGLEGQKTGELSKSIIIRWKSEWRPQRRIDPRGRRCTVITDIPTSVDGALVQAAC